MIKDLLFSNEFSKTSFATICLAGLLSVNGFSQTKLNSLNQARTASWTPTTQDLVVTNNSNGRIGLSMTDVTINQGWGTNSLIFPQNRRSWAISIIHGHQIMKNVLKIEKIPRGLLFAKSITESLCACDDGFIDDPLATHPLPSNSDVIDIAAAQRIMDKGCFQFTNNGALTAMQKFFNSHPRFIVGTGIPAWNDPFPNHTEAENNAASTRQVWGNLYETAALSSAYMSILAVRYLEVKRGLAPICFAAESEDPMALAKLMALGFNIGLDAPDFTTILETNRAANLLLPHLEDGIADGGLTADVHAYKIGNLCYALENKEGQMYDNLGFTMSATYTGVYDPQIVWADVQTYLDKISIMYTDVNWTSVVSTVKAKFDGINNGGSISFDNNMGEVIDELMLQLPIEDPSKQITWQAPTVVMDCGEPLAVGINELNQITNISIYPNPVNDITTVTFSLEKTSDVSIKVFNIMGTLVSSPVNGKTIFAGKGEAKINVSNFATGAYTVLISTSNGASLAKKIVVK